MDKFQKGKSLKEQNANSLLHSSILKGNISTLIQAFKLGCNLNSISKHGDLAIVAAAGIDPSVSCDEKSGKDKMTDILDLLLEQKECDINSRGVGGETALHRAFNARVEGRIKLLLKKGCDVDIRDSRGQTALFAATMFVEGLELLLAYNPLLDMYDVDGVTPLMHAMMSEAPHSLKVIQMLTNAGSDVNCSSPRDGKSALMVTIRPDDHIPRSAQRVKKSLILILNGINLDAQDVHGKTALHYAVASDCVELVKVLLKNKSSVDIKDNNGSTVKDMITKSSVNPEIVSLIEQAADKTSRLAPYEEALVALNSLHTSLCADGKVAKERKVTILAEISALERSMQELISIGRSADLMSVEHKRKLVSRKDVLCEEMMPHFILADLKADGILTEEDVQVISAEKSRKQMCEKLLQIILCRGEKAFPSLLRALHNSKQSHVCQILCEDGVVL
ncbi:hypothetical protein EB796_003104 [Bugula neritina]|uniref:CARD domain-containing protein n=1 Tax=Bugula neritina TaxID=10212 RepID=A0A7J7KKX1_BUGNE|nr:hypothetical protein EB796_003104 [Bugula neritina]